MLFTEKVWRGNYGKTLSSQKDNKLSAVLFIYLENVKFLIKNGNKEIKITNQPSIIMNMSYQQFPQPHP